MVVAARRDGADRDTPYTVDVPGGRLVITERVDGHLEMTGPAVLVAEGRLRPELLGDTRSRPRPGDLPGPPA
jgi:diaminopimelate epimerase